MKALLKITLLFKIITTINMKIINIHNISNNNKLIYHNINNNNKLMCHKINNNNKLMYHNINNSICNSKTIIIK